MQKKLLLLLLTLLLYGTSGWAQRQVTSVSEISPNKGYLLYNPHFTTYATAREDKIVVWAAGMTDDADHPMKNEEFALPLDPTSPYSTWRFIPNPETGRYCLYNIGKEKYAVVPEWQIGAGAYFDSTPATFSVTMQRNGEFCFNMTDTQYGYMCVAPHLSSPIAMWASSDVGAIWQIIENPEFANQGGGDTDIDSLIDHLVLSYKSGEKLLIYLSERPTMSYDGDYVIFDTSEHFYVAERSLLSNITFGKRGEDTGIHEVVADPDGNEGQMKYQSGYVIASGFKGGALAMVYDTAGKTWMQSRVGEDGTLELNLSGLPRGIYIVKIDNITYKFSKR